MVEHLCLFFCSWVSNYSGILRHVTSVVKRRQYNVKMMLVFFKMVEVNAEYFKEK